VNTIERWQLPEGVDELLPPRAAAAEALRRRLLDLYRSWGYQLVFPPLVEFTDSLLEGVGADLNLLTFKVPDQLSGRTLGIRADITPQVARIDAHSLADTGVSRLCYAGSILHARPQSLLASRAPVQVGAELFGESALAADVEIIRLMLATVECAQLDAGKSLTLDLGHSGVCAAVMASIAPELHAAVFDALQRKSRPDLEAALAAVPATQREVALALMDLHGEADVLARGRELLAGGFPEAGAAIDILGAIAEALGRSHPQLRVYFDLGELRGYHYHTGAVFALYVDGHGEAIANGGRYDNVGRSYGRARPATGFACDLKTLIHLQEDMPPPPRCIAAPSQDDPALQREVAALRAAGEVVVQSLGGEVDPRCDRVLVCEGGAWVMRELDPQQGLAAAAAGLTPPGG
jgi:ATP phosphoribosyltransferase regulatory subunit